MKRPSFRRVSLDDHLTPIQVTQIKQPAVIQTVVKPNLVWQGVEITSPPEQYQWVEVMRMCEGVTVSLGGLNSVGLGLDPFKLWFPCDENPELICWVTVDILASEDINAFDSDSSGNFLEFIWPFKKTKILTDVFRVKDWSTGVIWDRTGAAFENRTLNPWVIFKSKGIYLVCFLTLVVESSMNNYMFADEEWYVVSPLMEETMCVNLVPTQCVNVIDKHVTITFSRFEAFIIPFKATKHKEFWSPRDGNHTMSISLRWNNTSNVSWIFDFFPVPRHGVENVQIV